MIFTSQYLETLALFPLGWLCWFFYSNQQKQFSHAADVLNATSPDKKSETLLSLSQEIDLIAKQKDRGIEL